MHGGTISSGRSCTFAVSGLYSSSWNNSFSNTTVPSVVATLRPTSNTLSSVCDSGPAACRPAGAACRAAMLSPWVSIAFFCASGLSGEEVAGRRRVDPLLHREAHARLRLLVGLRRSRPAAAACARSAGTSAASEGRRRVRRPSRGRRSAGRSTLGAAPRPGRASASWFQSVVASSGSRLQSPQRLGRDAELASDFQTAGELAPGGAERSRLDCAERIGVCACEAASPWPAGLAAAVLRQWRQLSRRASSSTLENDSHVPRRPSRWLYVVVLMALAEAHQPRTAACSARLHLLLYGAAAAVDRALPDRHARAPARRAPRAPRRQRRSIQTAAAMRPVTPSRRYEKNRDASLTVHQAPPPIRAHARALPGARAPGRQVGQPLARPLGPEPAASARRRASAPKAVSTSSPDLEGVRADAGAQPGDRPRRVAARRPRTAPRRWLRARRRPGRASRHARRRRRGRPARRTAPAGSRRPAPCRRCRARW